MIKKVSCYLLACICIGLGVNAQDVAEFKCTIKNPLRDWVVVEKVIQPFSVKDTVKLDAENSFTYKTAELDDWQYYKIYYGDRKMAGDAVSGPDGMRVQMAYFVDYFGLSLNSGYKLNVFVDAQDKFNTLTIEGKGHEMSSFYLQKDAWQTDFQLRYGNISRLPKLAFTDSLNGYFKRQLNLINASLPQLKYLSKDFIETERNQLKYNTATRKISYASTMIARYKNDSIINEFDEKYFEFMKDIPLDNTPDKNTKQYTSIIRSYTNYMLVRRNLGARKSEPENFQAKFDIYKTLFKSDEVRDFQMFDLMYQYNVKAREKWYNDVALEFNSIVKNDSLKAELENILVIRRTMAKGMDVYDFTMFDSSGKAVKLSDFRGNYVVIDAWATWCKPCIQEIPFMQKLEKDMEGKPVVFISISIDESMAKWKGFVARRQLHGNQYWQGPSNGANNFKKMMLIQGIPRFIVIDREGRYVDPNAPRPSTPDLFTLLRGLDGLKFTRPSQAAENSN